MHRRSSSTRAQQRVAALPRAQLEKTLARARSVVVGMAQRGATRRASRRPARERDERIDRSTAAARDLHVARATHSKRGARLAGAEHSSDGVRTFANLLHKRVLGGVGRPLFAIDFCAASSKQTIATNRIKSVSNKTQCCRCTNQQWMSFVLFGVVVFFFFRIRIRILFIY